MVTPHMHERNAATEGAMDVDLATDAAGRSCPAMAIETLCSAEANLRDEQEVAAVLSHMAKGSMSPPPENGAQHRLSPAPSTDQCHHDGADAAAAANTSKDCQRMDPALCEDSNTGAGVGTATFFSRVSELPVVTSTMRTIGEVLESGKNNSRVIKTSAETMERILDTTKPVLHRVNTALEPRLGQLDVFACRQLDRLEKNYPIIRETPSSMYSSSKQVLGDAFSKWTPQYTGQQHEHQQSAGYEASDLDQESDQQHSSGSSMVARWNAYLSTESMKSLKYCLEWLQYATVHIDRQIHVLQDGVRHWTSTASESDALRSLVALAVHVKREVVETLRRVVDIISKYAGSALPAESRNLVRGFILNLPNRWASINGHLTGATAANNTAPEASRVLTLAEEVNTTLKSTMAVFSQAVTASQYFGLNAAGEAEVPPASVE